MGGQNALSYTSIVESLRQTPKRQICPCGRRGVKALNDNYEMNYNNILQRFYKNIFFEV